MKKNNVRIPLIIAMLLVGTNGNANEKPQLAGRLLGEWNKIFEKLTRPDRFIYGGE